jgi:hypothetical protein
VQPRDSEPGRSDGVSNLPSGHEGRDSLSRTGRWLHESVTLEIQASMGQSTAFEGSPEDLRNFLAARQDPVLLTLSPWLHHLEQYMAVVEEAAVHLSGKLGVVWVVDKCAYVARLMRRARLLRCWKRGMM